MWYQSILPDSAQNLAWGHTWAWSYNRHPPLGTWLISIISLFSGNNEIATYSASVICLSISLIFIYLLSKRYLSPETAIAASVLSSFSLYYLINFVLQFNQNTIMLPFWVMICYFFDTCLRTNQLRHWLILSIVTAGAVLAKYESLIIIFLSLIYLFFNFKKKYLVKLLIAFLLTLTFLTPHILSMTQHGFLTIEFIFQRIGEGQNHSILYNHLYFPLKALVEQLGHILFVLLVLVLLLNNKKITRLCNKDISNQLNFLVYLGITPLVFVILISFIFGVSIRAEWGFPLFSFTLPAIFSFFQLQYRASFLKSLIYFGLFIHLVSLTAYISFNYYSTKFDRTSQPSYILAKSAKSYWKKHTNMPLNYIGGDETVDYYLAAYLPNKPLLFEALSFKQSPWLNKIQLKKAGMLFVIENCEATKIMLLKKNYSAINPECISLPYNNKHRELFKKYTLMMVPPIEVG